MIAKKGLAYLGLLYLRLSVETGIGYQVSGRIGDMKLTFNFSVASTTVPALSMRPRWLSNSLTSSWMAWASLFFSNRYLKRRMVLSSGTRSNSCNWSNSRYSGVSKKASSMAGSHCYMKCTRSMHSKENGGRPFLPSG